MSLNPFRSALNPAVPASAGAGNPFQAETDAALAAFRSQKVDLERQVRRGDLTVKVARDMAARAAAEVRDRLHGRAESFSPAPRAFLDRLVEADKARSMARERQGIEGLQRETNRLLRQSLVEQQIVNRAAEFEARASVRPMGGGAPSPTLDSLLALHESATVGGDEAAREWARRGLEAMRPLILDEADHVRIDRACDRPDQVNPRTVARYVEALAGAEPEALELFVAEAVAGRDANACVASFLMARETPEGPSLRWVRSVLNGLGDFPDPALSALRGHEAARRQAEADAARVQAEHAAALAAAEARLPHLEMPGAAALDRMARLEGLPVAAPDQPIGLAPRRRGLNRDELAAADAAHDTDDLA